MAAVSAGDDTGSNNVEQKKCFVTDRLLKRDEERLLQIQQRKAVKEETSLSVETVQYFTDHFSKMRSEVERGLTDYSADLHGPAELYINNLLLEVQKLQKYLTDSTHFLSGYEVKRAQTMVNQLKVDIDLKKGEIAPKKKFAFKSDKKKLTAQAVDSTANDTKNVNAVVESPPIVALKPNECGFLNRDDEKMMMSSDEINGNDVVLSSLTNCQVTLRGAPSTVHMNALNKCVVLCGPTSGSIFIDDCRCCTFVVACQQLRVHRTSESSFYLHVTSRAIIEDCSTVTFAPYSWQYAELEEDFRRAGLDQHRNNWNCVDDFNWLALDTHSPNWTVMDESRRAVFPN